MHKAARTILAVGMSLCLILMYSVTAFAEGTDETVYKCGKVEHTHSADCYTTQCPVEEHTHGESCKELICTEHVHDTSCYDEEHNLTCEIESDHVHTDACYDITCGKEEHTHGDTCVPTEVLTCGQEEHTHSIKCTVNEGTVALIGSIEYKSLDDAVKAAEASDEQDTIILFQDCTTEGFNLSKDLTIEGAEGVCPTITFTEYGIALWGSALTFKDCNVVMDGIGSTPYGEWNWMAICASKDASLTLDYVNMTMDGTDAGDHAIYFCSNNQLNINESTLEIKNYAQDALEWNGGDGGYNVNITNSTFISDHNRSGFTGTFCATILNSKVDVINSRGNGSNGSHFIIDNSIVNFNDNGAHGLSAGNLTIINNSEVSACGNGGNGIHVSKELHADNSSITVSNNECSVISKYSIPAALYIGSGGEIADSCKDVSIDNNGGTGIYVRSGTFVMQTGTVVKNMAKALEIPAELVNNPAYNVGYGGGINNHGTTKLENVVLYNNHADIAGDDIYNVAGATITFGRVGNDWYLDDCTPNDKITGWFYDDEIQIATRSLDSTPGYEGGRWSVAGCNGAEKTNAYEFKVVEDNMPINYKIALKAAHGILPPPYIPSVDPGVEPETVYTVTYMDGVDDEVVFEDQSTTDLKAGDKTPEFTGSLERDGYKFIGWTPVVADIVTGDAVYVAQWEKIEDDDPAVEPSGDTDPVDGDDSDSEDKGVKTGDESVLYLWLGLAAVAALGLGGTLVTGRRKENE